MHGATLSGRAVGERGAAMHGGRAFAVGAGTGWTMAACNGRVRGQFALTCGVGTGGVRERLHGKGAKEKNEAGRGHAERYFSSPGRRDRAGAGDCRRQANVTPGGKPRLPGSVPAVERELAAAAGQFYDAFAESVVGAVAVHGAVHGLRSRDAGAGNYEFAAAQHFGEVIPWQAADAEAGGGQAGHGDQAVDGEHVVRGSMRFEPAVVDHVQARFPALAQQRQRGDVGGGVDPAGVDHVRTAHPGEFQSLQRGDLQARLGELAVQKCHVELAGLQPFLQVGTQINVWLQGDARIMRAQQADERRQPGHGGDLGDAETEGAGQGVLSFQAHQQPVPVAQHLFCEREGFVAARCEFGAMARAVEQGHVEVGFQLLDALGDGRLGGVQLLGGSGKRAQAHGPVKGLNLFEGQHGLGSSFLKFY